MRSAPTSSCSRSGGFDGFSPAVGDAVAALPAVGQVDRLRFDQAQVRDEVVGVTSVPPSALGRTVDLVPVAGDVDELSGTARSCCRKGHAEDLGVSPGDTLPVRFSRGAERHRHGRRHVRATTSSSVRTCSPDSAARDFTSAAGRRVLLVDARDGTCAADLRAAVDAAAAGFPTVEVLDREEFTAAGRPRRST